MPMEATKLLMNRRQLWESSMASTMAMKPMMLFWMRYSWAMRFMLMPMSRMREISLRASNRFRSVITEMTMVPILATEKPKEQELRLGITKLLSYLISRGVTTIFEAGNMTDEDLIFRTFREMDEEGKIREEAFPVVYYVNRTVGKRPVISYRPEIQGELP